MGVLSMDMKEKRKVELTTAIAQAMKANDETAIAKAFADFSEFVQKSILDDQAEFQNTANADATALAARGYRQLTTAETKYYTALEQAFKAADVKMALSNLEVAMPETVVDSVLDDITTEHPLLDMIDFQNTRGAVKMIVNVGDTEMAVWGHITDAKKKELSGNIKEVDAKFLKLMAYIPVPKAMLDGNIGPVWLDAYIRKMLSESVALGMETGIVSGDGDETPIGMIRKVGKNANVVGGKYAKKDAVKVKNFGKKTYGSLLAKLSKNSETGAYRNINQVILVVNPADYFEAVMPATTMLASSGVYVKDIFPFPTTVIKSVAVDVGEAVIGIPNRYYMCAGMPKGGKIEYDDSCQFLDDVRVYLAKMYANAFPKDDNSFMLLDISELEEMRYPVTTWTEAPEADGV